MSTFPWKVSGKGFSRSGVVEAASDREALSRVLGGQVPLGFSPKGGESYSITVGPLTTSAYGDEFERVAGAHSIDETNLDMSQGHLFDDPVKRKLLDAYLDEEDVDRILGSHDGTPPTHYDCGHTVHTCKEKFDNVKNFGGWPGQGIQPPGQARAPVQAKPEQWQLSQEIETMDRRRFSGGIDRVVTDIHRSVEATFDGAAAQAVMDAVRNGEEIQIRHDIGDGTPLVVRFFPTSATQHADGTVSVEGPVTHHHLDP